MHGITHVAEVWIGRLAASPVALLCHAATVAHDMLQSADFRQRVAIGNGGQPLAGGTSVTITPSFDAGEKHEIAAVLHKVRCRRPWPATGRRTAQAAGGTAHRGRWRW